MMIWSDLMDKELIKEMIEYIEKKEVIYPELYYKLKDWMDENAEIVEVNYFDGDKDYYKNGKKMY